MTDRRGASIFVITSATTLPHLVIVIGSPSTCISSIRRRHFALNSPALTTLFRGSPFDLYTSYGHLADVRQ